MAPVIEGMHFWREHMSLSAARQEYVEGLDTYSSPQRGG